MLLTLFIRHSTSFYPQFSFFCVMIVFFCFPSKGVLDGWSLRLLCIQRHNACKNSGSRRHNVYEYEHQVRVCNKTEESSLFLHYSSNILSTERSLPRCCCCIYLHGPLVWCRFSYFACARGRILCRKFCPLVVRFSVCLFVADHCLFRSPCGAYLTTNWANDFLFLSSQGQEILRHRRNRNITTADLFVLSA